MNIGGREIGTESLPYIVAEIGVNHDGSVARALELTDAAADAGADAVKLQYFRTDLLMSRAAKLAAYQKNAGETDPVEMLRRLELDRDALACVVERAHAHGIHAIVTPFSVELVDELEPLGWGAFKTASPDIVHRPLLERLVATGRPMIVSTGASTMEEVARAVGWLDPARNRLALLQCVSCYPAPDEAIGGIGALRDATGLPVGYSDHTDSEGTGAAAVANGACVLEKHFTYDRSSHGPDHRASLEPDAFARYATLARSEPVSAGECRQEKRVLDCERNVREVSRQSIVTTRALEPGHTITRGDLTFKRPGTGFEPWRLDEVVGQTTAHAVEADVPVTPDDLVQATIHGSKHR